MDPSTLTVAPQNDGTFCVVVTLPDGSTQPFSAASGPSDPSGDPGAGGDAPGCFSSEAEAQAFLAGVQAASSAPEDDDSADDADGGDEAGDSGASGDDTVTACACLPCDIGALVAGGVAQEALTAAGAAINDLPDSAFAYIEPGGAKDKDGKTAPRSKRHFPIHDASHVRNALARAGQSPFGRKALPKIKAAAKKFGVQVAASLVADVDGQDADPDAPPAPDQGSPNPVGPQPDGQTVTLQLDLPTAQMLAGLAAAFADLIQDPDQDGDDDLDPDADPDGDGAGADSGGDDGTVTPDHGIVASAKPVGVVAAPNLGIAPRDTPWDGQAAAKHLLDANTSSSGRINVKSAGKGFAYVAEDGTRAVDYNLPFADVVSGKVKVIPAGVIAVADRIFKGAANLGISDDDSAKIKKVLDRYFATMAKQFKDPTMVAPWNSLPPAGQPMPDKGDGGSGDDAPAKARTASLLAAVGIPDPGRALRDAEVEFLEECFRMGAKAVVASVTAPAHPPRAWFDDPHFDAPTPLTVTSDGRVYGHVAEWNRCHVGLPRCVTPPRSLAAYAWFNRRNLTTAEGDTVPVGVLTLGTGHATLDLSPRASADHYDNTGTVAAVVRAAEDRFGPYIVGALRPELDDISRWELDFADLSGDWREINGNLELVGCLAVNVPGFPITPPAIAASAAEEDPVTAAIALGPVSRGHIAAAAAGRLAERVRASVGMDRASRARRIRERVALPAAPE